MKNIMENLKNKKVVFIDSGLFVEFARTVSKYFGTSYYFTPWNQGGFPRRNAELPGSGYKELINIDYLFENSSNETGYKFDEIDEFIFLDVYFSDIQTHLREMGKRVFGSGDGEDLELFRWQAKKILRKSELPVKETIRIKGVDALRNKLKEVKNKYIKIDHWRGEFECVDDQTEIFTYKGWIFFKDLTDQKILSMDLNTRDTEFVPINHYFAKYYEGKMYEIKSRRLDLLVTPKHKFFNRYHTTTKWKYEPIEDIYKRLHADTSNISIPVIFNWKGISPIEYIIPINENITRTIEEIKIPIDLWLKFLGWFISEGCIDLVGYDKNKYRITISQSLEANPVKYNEIKNILDLLGFNYQIENKIGFSIYNKQLYEELSKTCYNEGLCPICNKNHCSHIKCIPDYLKNYSSDLINIFLTEFIKGDGNVPKIKNEIRLYSSSHVLLYGLQELIYKTGKQGTLHFRKKLRSHTVKSGLTFHDRVISGHVSIINGSDVRILKNNIKEVDYAGNIYDVNVEPYHSILIRRNNKVCWTGNTFRHDDYKLTEPILDQLEHNLGVKKYETEFLIEDEIKSVCEFGIDTINIDGKVPEKVFAGIEVKGCVYGGKVFDFKSLPKFITKCQTNLEWYFKEKQYRMCYSNEIRITEEKKGYLIDPCCRLGDPPNCVYQNMIDNWGDIIWYGAEGILIEPEYNSIYGVQIIIYSNWVTKNWQAVYFPKEAEHNIKLRNSCMIKGNYYCVPSVSESSNVGSAVGTGKTMEEALEEAKRYAEMIKGYGLEVEIDQLGKLEEAIESAEKIGITF